MYVALTRAKPEPWQYVVGNALKVVGGVAGGVVLATASTWNNLTAEGIRARR
jgi:hypothetical protein